MHVIITMYRVLHSTAILIISYRTYCKFIVETFLVYMKNTDIDQTADKNESLSFIEHEATLLHTRAIT